MSIHNSGHTNGLFRQIKKQFLAVWVFLVVCIHHSPPLVIEHFLGLFILQGLNPSPQVEMKFNSQQVDPVQGNDLCYRIFGANALV